MNKQKTEDLYLQSLDQKLTSDEEAALSSALVADPNLAASLSEYKTLREIFRTKTQASFGPYFASRVVHRIQNAGAIIDRQIFGLFKKMQLAAIGVIVALLILNLVFSEQVSWKSTLGLDSETPATTEEQAAPFDFSQTLNNL